MGKHSIEKEKKKINLKKEIIAILVIIALVFGINFILSHRNLQEEQKNIEKKSEIKNSKTIEGEKLVIKSNSEYNRIVEYTFENNILNGSCYILELDFSKIEYGIINGFNMDESLLLKVVTLTQKIIDEKDLKTIDELKQLIGNNTGFFNKKTIFKVKKDEK